MQFHAAAAYTIYFVVAGFLMLMNNTKFQRQPQDGLNDIIKKIELIFYTRVIRP